MLCVACYVIKDGSSEWESPALGKVLKVCITYKRFHRTSACFRPLVMQSPFSRIYGLYGQGIGDVFKNSWFGL